jgi:hypothetical protein
MPKQLTAGKAGTITVTLVDDNGAAVQASAVSWKLFDEVGNELFAGTVDSFNANDPTARVDLTAEQTTTTEPMVARELIVECTTATDTVEVREAFLIVSAVPLTVAENTFQTLTESLLTRAEFASLPGWDRATRDQQIAAMIQAYRHIVRVPLTLQALPDTYNRINWWGRKVPLARLDAAEFNELPLAFRRAVKRAQLAEANVLLGGDRVGDKIRAGIVSETTGESSMFFNSKPYLNLPISKQAYEELKSFVRLVVQVARA